MDADAVDVVEEDVVEAAVESVVVVVADGTGRIIKTITTIITIPVDLLRMTVIGNKEVVDTIITKIIIISKASNNKDIITINNNNNPRLSNSNNRLKEEVVGAIRTCRLPNRLLRTKSSLYFYSIDTALDLVTIALLPTYLPHYYFCVCFVIHVYNRQGETHYPR